MQLSTLASLKSVRLMLLAALAVFYTFATFASPAEARSGKDSDRDGMSNSWESKHGFKVHKSDGKR
ncbi:MAG TPA: hypothetical protein VEV82_09480, partial [Actinomycetota bacterium]|nr:hypothetical protein [Actinomycetota bacterium]